MNGNTLNQLLQAQRYIQALMLQPGQDMERQHENQKLRDRIDKLVLKQIYVLVDAVEEQ